MDTVIARVAFAAIAPIGTVALIFATAGWRLMDTVLALIVVLVVAWLLVVFIGRRR